MAGAAGVISDEIRELLENEQDAEYEEVRCVGGVWIRHVVSVDVVGPLLLPFHD